MSDSKNTPAKNPPSTQPSPAPKPPLPTPPQNQIVKGGHTPPSREIEITHRGKK